MNKRIGWQRVEWLLSVKPMEKDTMLTLGYILIVILIAMILVTLFLIYIKVRSTDRELYEEFEKLGFVKGEDNRKKIRNLLKLLENMNNNYSFTEMIDFINQTFSEFIPYNYIGVGLIDKDNKILKAMYGVSDGSIVGLPDRLLGKGSSLTDTSLGGVIERGEARIINDLEAYTKGKPIKPYNKVIMEAGIQSSITLPLQVDGEPVGVIFFSSNQKNRYKESHIALLKLLVTSIAVSFKQNLFIDGLIYSNTLALAKLAEARDEDTGEHLERMKTYSVKIAEFLYQDGIYEKQLSLEYISQIQRFSPLHDIGKVGIQDGILLKPGKLSDEEFEEMKKHTVLGGEVLKVAEDTVGIHNTSLFGVGIEIAVGHHEKWDGSGYPNGKKGLEIPLSARIVAIGDVLDALTSERPYKKAFSFESSFQLIVEGSGTHFDPNIIESLIRHRTEIYQTYQKFHSKDEISI